MELNEYQKWAVDFFKEQGWYNLDVAIRLNFLTEEVGELSQAIRRYEIGRDRPDEEVLSQEENKSFIREELADVLDNVFILMEKYDISFEEMAHEHQEKFEKRYRN